MKDSASGVFSLILLCDKLDTLHGQTVNALHQIVMIFVETDVDFMAHSRIRRAYSSLSSAPLRSMTAMGTIVEIACL